MLKRIFDISFSFIGILVLLPILLLISLMIKITMAGPVFFIQQRVGKDGKLFMLYKFRTMRVTEFSKAGSFEPGKTSRITTIGRFLRRTKLDELPQLFNVLKGDMSIVGPRPEVEKWVAVYPERWNNVLKVKPGITEKSSVLFRSEESLLTESADPERTYKETILPEKLDLYEEYVSNHSFFGDIKIICITLFHLFYPN